MASINRKLPGKTDLVRPIATAEKRILDPRTDIIERLIELALGVALPQENDNAPHVYTRRPNKQAAQYLVDRILGQPSLSVETSGPQKRRTAIPYDFETLKKRDTVELLRLHRETLGE